MDFLALHPIRGPVAHYGVKAAFVMFPRPRDSPAGYATQYFVGDVCLRQTLDLDIGNIQGGILRYEDGGTNAQASSREPGL